MLCTLGWTEPIWRKEKTRGEPECSSRVRSRGWSPTILPHQLLDFGGLALGLVPRIRVPAMNALLTESGASPDQIVHGALQLLDAVGQVARRVLGICHGR